jgi:hypothetical protein
MGHSWAGPVGKGFAEAVEGFAVACVTGYLIEICQAEKEGCLRPMVGWVLRGIGKLPIGHPLHVLENLRGLRIGSEGLGYDRKADEGQIFHGKMARCDGWVHG